MIREWMCILVEILINNVYLVLISVIRVDTTCDTCDTCIDISLFNYGKRRYVIQFPLILDTYLTRLYTQ